MRGLYWEEWEIGAEFESPGRPETEADSVLFAGLFGDYDRSCTPSRRHIDRLSRDLNRPQEMIV